MPIVDGRGVLISHWMPLANAALRAGHAAFLAQRRAAEARTRYRQVVHVPLPESQRERGWAVKTRERMLGEARDAAANAANQVERWARLMDRLLVLSPGAADEVDYAVWDVPERANAVAAIREWESTFGGAR